MEEIRVATVVVKVEKHAGVDGECADVMRPSDGLLRLAES